eukprot:6458993-Amphidinium_carterae.6
MKRESSLYKFWKRWYRLDNLQPIRVVLFGNHETSSNLDCTVLPSRFAPRDSTKALSGLWLVATHVCRGVQGWAPDIVIQECTRTFDVGSYKECLGEDYDVQQLVFSPTDLHLPVARTRSYTIALRRERLRRKLDWGIETASRLVFVGPERPFKGSIFARAPQSMRDSILAELMKRRQSVSGDPREPSFYSMLTDAARGRLCAFFEQAHWASLEYMIADISQNPKFHASLSMTLPCFSRSSELWICRIADGVETSRPFCSYELLGALGWPVLLAASNGRLKDNGEI